MLEADFFVRARGSSMPLGHLSRGCSISPRMGFFDTSADRSCIFSTEKISEVWAGGNLFLTENKLSEVHVCGPESKLTASVQVFNIFVRKLQKYLENLFDSHDQNKKHPYWVLFVLVPEVGIEPTRGIASRHFKCRLSTNSSTRAKILWRKFALRLKIFSSKNFRLGTDSRPILVNGSPLRRFDSARKKLRFFLET